jgi:hypothetical protein
MEVSWDPPCAMWRPAGALQPFAVELRGHSDRGGTWPRALVLAERKGGNLPVENVDNLGFF